MSHHMLVVGLGFFIQFLTFLTRCHVGVEVISTVTTCVYLHVCLRYADLPGDN